LLRRHKGEGYRQLEFYTIIDKYFIIHTLGKMRYRNIDWIANRVEELLEMIRPRYFCSNSCSPCHYNRVIMAKKGKNKERATSNKGTTPIIYSIFTPKQRNRTDMRSTNYSYFQYYIYYEIHPYLFLMLLLHEYDTLYPTDSYIYANLWRNKLR
jgi:hypothetical protein